jgi:hypothetical protein
MTKLSNAKKQDPSADLQVAEAGAASDTPVAEFSIDGVDLAELEMSQDFEALTPVEDLLTDVPIRKPKPQEFVRVHPEYRKSFRVLEHERDQRKLYLATPAVHRVAADHTKPFTFRLAVNAQGLLFLWPLRMAGSDETLWPAWESAAEQARRAEAEWIQVYWHKGLGLYQVRRPFGNFGDPAWPKESFQEILNIGFKGRVIKDVDHPVIKELLGKA